MLLFGFEPPSALFPVMHPQVVENQEYFLFGVFDQPGHEFDECLGVHGIPIEHEAGIAAIRDSGYHVYFQSFRVEQHDRSLAFR